MALPEGVETKTIRKKSGKAYTYYYWNPGRNTDREGERIKLPDATKHPARFFAEVERRRNSTPTSYPAGSIGDLITRYRASDEFKRLSEGTQSNYEVHMRRFEAHDTWGMVAVRDLAPITVQTARDAMKETAVMANQMLSVGRTIWDWAIPLDLAKFNPFDKVRDFDIPDRGHVPWPSWVIDYVRTHAWPDLVRMMRLGVMTCQRGSDLIRMGPEHRDRNGLWCRPLKTRKRRRSFHIPLAAADALEIDQWAETPVTFTNSRWLKPIDRFREDLYLYSPKGAQYTADGLRARVGVAGLPTPRKDGRYVAAGKNGLPPRSRSTIGTSSPTTLTIRPSTACAAPASWRAPSKATRSTRSRTTSACPGRTSSTTCASRIRCRSRPKGKSGFGWSRTRTRPRTFGQLYHHYQTPDLENSSAILENFRKKCCKISHFGGEWCNGSTTDSDSVCLGSNPSSPASPPLRSPVGSFFQKS